MPTQQKLHTLRNEGTLNPRADRVRDPKFREGDFFDPRDLVQVKYEMLRRVRTDAVSITQAVAEVGFSRPTFYEANAHFAQAGLSGLVPKKRGPRGPHKLRQEVTDFLLAGVGPGQPVHAAALAHTVRQRFGLDVHPRTIERAVRRGKKTPR
jgi:transposase